MFLFTTSHFESQIDKLTHEADSAIESSKAYYHSYQNIIKERDETLNNYELIKEKYDSLKNTKDIVAHYEQERTNLRRASLPQFDSILRAELPQDLR